MRWERSREMLHCLPRKISFSKAKSSGLWLPSETVARALLQGKGDVWRCCRAPGCHHRGCMKKGKSWTPLYPPIGPASSWWFYSEVEKALAEAKNVLKGKTSTQPQRHFTWRHSPVTWYRKTMG